MIVGVGVLVGDMVGVGDGVAVDVGVSVEVGALVGNAVWVGDGVLVGAGVGMTGDEVTTMTGSPVTDSVVNDRVSDPQQAEANVRNTQGSTRKCSLTGLLRMVLGTGRRSP